MAALNSCRQRSIFSCIGDRLVVISEPQKIWGSLFSSFRVLEGLWGLRGLCFQDTKLVLSLIAFIPSVISSFFNQKYGRGLGPPGPSPRSTTVEVS